MTREEARKILGEGASENQVTNLLNNFQEQTKSYQEQISELQNKNKGYETKLNDYQSKLDETSQYKVELDKIKEANMSEQEKIEAQKEEAQRILNEAKLTLNTAKVKAILAGENISDDSLMDLVDTDTEKSIKRANTFKNLLNVTREETEKKTREQLTKISVEPKLSNVPQGNDKIDIDKFLDMSAEDQEKFANEHPDQYNALIN